MLEEVNQPFKYAPQDVDSKIKSMPASEQKAEVDPTIGPLRKILIDEDADMGRRYRALFSLKYLACQQPPTEFSEPAIEAIAAAFVSKSELLKHECAYCLGQTRNEAAV
ncbi:deoxyhypusine hydroxylase, partial [Ascosphaera atra]